MTLAVILATLVAIPLLAIVSFMQVLYLESMRLRTRDLPAIQAGALIMAATYSIVNFLADLAYAWIDKRIQYA